MARARALLADAQFRRGAADMMPFAPGLVAWGVVTGVAMVQSGLGVGLATLMSLTVFAGSAQLASLPLLAVQAPSWIVWASALCVNLRFVIFSAQWRVHFGHLTRGRRLLLGYLLADLNLIVFQKAWPGGQREPGQVPYIIGGLVTCWLLWQVSSLVGIFLASMVPMSWGLGFAGTLSVLGLVYGLLNGPGTWLAAALAAAASIAAFSLPLKLNILVAIVAAVASALVMDQARQAAGRLRPPPP